MMFLQNYVAILYILDPPYVTSVRDGTITDHDQIFNCGLDSLTKNFNFLNGHDVIYHSHYICGNLSHTIKGLILVDVISRHFSAVWWLIMTKWIHMSRSLLVALLVRVSSRMYCKCLYFLSEVRGNATYLSLAILTSFWFRSTFRLIMSKLSAAGCTLLKRNFQLFR